ncbi:MAG TPA: PhzF family phenazine biosynthesis isomerase [Longimicrobium sp.]|jgi:trans-2,3-dihydro-3-hydroxyanthranilate isomerase
MRYRYHTLDVFTDRPFGGNPLAVFPDARGLSAWQMQSVARELNLSETVFVLPAEAGGTRRVRIFTPGGELPFAGHPTVGTAILLVALGEVPAEDGEVEVVLEEGVGPVPVVVRVRGGKAEFARFTAPQAPEFLPPPPAPAELAAALGLDVADLADAPWEPAVVSCGVPFTVIPLRDADALARARLDPAAWERVLAGSGGPHVYPVVPAAPGGTVRVRMFSPTMGIAEDPATGAAAAALGGYLARGSGAGTLSWTVEQGLEMGRPSRIELEADVADGRAAAVRVGGSAILMSEGTMEIPGENAERARAWEPVDLAGAPVGAYSRAIRAGDLVFVSGQVPRDLETGELMGTTLAEQTRAVLENVRRVLAAAGATLDDVVSVTAYLEEIGDWGEFNAVYREAFSAPYPTRTTVGASLHDVLVEITVIARVRP